MKIQLDFDNISHMMNLTSNSIAQFKYKGFIKHQDLNMNLRIGYNHLITINKDHKEKRTLSTNLKNVCLKKYKEFLQDNSYFIAADFHPEKKKIPRAFHEDNSHAENYFAERHKLET